jgi:spore maturation protein CgeB
MIKRIDLFMPPENKSRYNVLPHFTMKFAEALSRAGVSCRLLRAEKNNPKPFLEALFDDTPDCTLSFNGLLPDDKGQFFCDTLKIPHVACLIDSPTQYLALANSDYTIITVPDRFSREFLQGLKCPNVIFMPHGVEKEISYNPGQTRRYDVVMLSSCIDYEAIALQWKKKYSKEICEVMHEAADITLKSKGLSAIQAFVQVMDRRAASSLISTEQLNFPEIIDEVEIYCKGRDRVELVRAIKGVDLHLFGSHMELWKKYLGDKRGIHFHEAVSYDVALEIMQQSKIVLNSCAWLKDGTHERILAAIASGALVLTNENIYMSEHFSDGENIAFYEMGNWEQANEKVHHYLRNEKLREKAVENGFGIVKRHHTWDQRAKSLLKELPAALNRVHSI